MCVCIMYVYTLADPELGKAGNFPLSTKFIDDFFAYFLFLTLWGLSRI